LSPGRRGLAAQDGSQVVVQRAVLERNRDAGVVAFDADTVLDLTDVVVRDTLERECTTDTCAGAGAGIGVGTYGGAHVEATRFAINRSALCGIQLAHGGDDSGVRSPEGGTADLREGEIAHNAVCGANIQTEGFNIDRLLDNVVFYDNGINLDMTELQVPDPAPPMADL
jgi:hypothetical protein